MASVGVRKRVSARTGRVTYQVWWLLDDGSQGAETVATKDEARDLVARKRLGVTRGAWQGLQRGQLPFSWWAEQWWEIWATDPDRSPTTLAITESRLRLYVRPWFGEKPIKRIGPADLRRWQAHLATSTGHATLMQCRSLVLRILQFAVDEGAIDSNPVRKVPSPRRRADPEQVLDQAKRRALTPEEAGRLLEGLRAEARHVEELAPAEIDDRLLGNVDVSEVAGDVQVLLQILLHELHLRAHLREVLVVEQRRLEAVRVTGLGEQTAREIPIEREALDMQLQDKLLAYKRDMGLLGAGGAPAPQALPAEGETTGGNQNGAGGSRVS